MVMMMVMMMMMVMVMMMMMMMMMMIQQRRKGVRVGRGTSRKYDFAGFRWILQEALQDFASFCVRSGDHKFMKKDSHMMHHVLMPGYSLHGNLLWQIYDKKKWLHGHPHSAHYLCCCPSAAPPVSCQPAR